MQEIIFCHSFSFSFKIDLMFASVIDVKDIVETRNCNPHSLPKTTEDPLN